MRRQRLIGGALVAGLLVVMLGGPVAADERGPENEAGAFVDHSGDPTAVAAQAGATGRGGSSGGGGAGPSQAAVAVPGGTGAARELLSEGLVSPEALALQAVESVGIGPPVIRTSPPSGALVVRIPTWLWVEGSWWRSYSASATAGLVTATVAAQPVRATWSMGDGSTLSCTGAGVPWTPGLAEDASDCVHVYTNSSQSEPGGTYPVTVAVEFSVSWSSNIGVGGSLGTISRTGTEAVRVGEIQAVETR